MAGIGNAGGGITYFVMPAIFDSLVEKRNHTPHKAWRVTFVVPFILITATALGMIFFCEDTPTGPWSERHLHVRECAERAVAKDKTNVNATGTFFGPDDHSSRLSEEGRMFDAKNLEKVAESEVVQAPTLKEALAVVLSRQCLLLSVAYACSFGGELAINNVLGAYYNKNFPYLGQTKSGQWY